MQESQQLQLEDHKDVSDLMDDEVTVCDTCGVIGFQSDIIVCNKCYDGAEHTYCMRDGEKSKLKVDGYWTCQECLPRKGTNKLVQDEVELPTRRKKGLLSKSLTICESSEVSKLKSKGVELSTNKHQVLLTTKSMRKYRDSSDLCEDSSSKQVKKAKTKSLNEIVFPIAKRSDGDTLFSRLVIPDVDCTWRGKFQIHDINGIARTLDGIQAHLSTCASPKVLEVVKRLPETIMLDGLPRFRIWPSQFMGDQVAEENIAMYFFACDDDSYKYYQRLMNYMVKKDLALKGNLDEIELLIFPSNVMPEKSQRWNQMFFFWGVFKGPKTKRLVTTPVPNLLKIENGDEKCFPFDLNAEPLDEDDTIGNSEIPDDKSGLEVLIDAIALLHEDNSNDKGKEANPELVSIDINVSLWSDSETP